MAVTRQKKSEILATLEDQFARAKSVAFAEYRGTNVADTQRLRRELRGVGAELVVAKKTLIKLAAKKVAQIELPDSVLEGPIAAVFSYEDEVAAAQIVQKFGKATETVKLAGGVLAADVLDRRQITQLASLPSKPALVGQFLSVLIAPLRGIMGIGTGLLSATARVLSEIEKKKAGEA